MIHNLEARGGAEPDGVAQRCSTMDHESLTINLIAHPTRFTSTFALRPLSS